VPPCKRALTRVAWRGSLLWVKSLPCSSLRLLLVRDLEAKR